MPSGLLVIGIAVVVLSVVLLIVFLAFTYMRGSQKPGNTVTTKIAPDARIDDISDRPSSIVSEQIEAMARTELERVGLGDRHIDFGTVHDGTIDVWVDGVQYDNPEDIPEAAIRDAISSAVAKFNAS